MPSPIAHVTAGYVLYRIFRKWHRHFSASGWRVFLLFAGLSLAPDLDAILGMVFGPFGQFHNNITHSLLAAIPISVCVYLFLKITRLNPAVPWAVATAACYGMHVAMDFFTHGRGIMAFWPITCERFISPVLFFYGLHWSEGWLSSSHLVTIATEGIPSAIAIGITYYALRNKDHFICAGFCVLL
jgi:membrane-bound metal-dependent hydrolase YbcI (DUF457 family)